MTRDVAKSPADGGAAPAPSAHPLRGMPYRMADDFDAPMPGLALAVAESGPDFGASADRR